MSIYSPQSLAETKGVGEVSIAKLREAGINSKLDLINFLPRTYREIKFTPNLASVRPGEITVRARAKNIKLRRTNRALTLLTADLVDKTGKIQAVWFNQPYRQNQLKQGEFYFSGRFEFARGHYQLTNPSVQLANSRNDDLGKDRLQPIYSTVRGLKSSFFDKVFDNLKPDILTLNESLPEVVTKELDLITRSDGLYYLHFPTSRKQIEAAQRREQIEEAFVASLASLINGLDQKAQPAESIPIDAELLQQFVASLSFQLTDDQKKAIWRISKFMNQSHPMNLLLQGDVGSGKTVVAAAAGLTVAKAGHQVAFMVPTEILASQHFETLKRNLKPFKMRIELLTSSVKGKARRQIYDDLATGKIDLIVGTHALIQDDVKFKSLALAIIDEQHRFGVAQRQQLVSKADKMPHLLSMTATPIPRSLALTLRNELSIASIRQKPANRLPIKTTVYHESDRSDVYNLIRQQLDAGRQGYLVCRQIDEDEDESVKSVENLFKRLSKREFQNYRLGMLHGQMKSDQKAKIMADFVAHEIDLLVATTVIEVGVDIGNATVMMIEDADNYGLSQLHQLRGRVGRSEHQGYCYLIAADSNNRRLQTIAESEDGFYLAEVDLEMRGEGSLFGTEQSGWFHTITNLRALEEAQKGLEAYQNWLKKKGLSVQQHLKELPELQARINQFDQLTVLN